MSKQREALEMALDALRGWIGIDEWIWPVTAKETCKKNSLEAITAIREALAEPEPALQLCKCRAALDEILAAKPRLAAGYYECGNMKDTIGNLRAELYDYRPQGVFGIGDEE